MGVTQEPMLLETTLWKNLTLGHSGGDSMHTFKILNRLGLQDLAESVNLELSHPQHEGENQWWKRLSNADIAKIHVARALIANSEMLVLHRPCANFDSTQSDELMDLLGEYIEDRGVEIEGPLRSRRPRTLFYSSDYPELETQWADMVWEVCEGKVTQRLGHKC